MIAPGDVVKRRADGAQFLVSGSDDSRGRPVWVLSPCIFGPPITASADELRGDYVSQRDAQDPEQPDAARGWKNLARRHKLATMAAAVEAGELESEDAYNASLRADADPAAALDRHADLLPDDELGDERTAKLGRLARRLRGPRALTPEEALAGGSRSRTDG